ncbi:ATP-dependent RNA helicase HrpA [Jatrophihabitans endophyticus]|uniref:ATP-dependent RNA helicase HrpA n=1 Tax=Jatrophihabitans endophyticus TaxID=1206085 RepID=UPI0026EB61FA|nr:ATP-dependent RNA helicase HrpA [Jatrophihabitans endophyticus]
MPGRPSPQLIAAREAAVPDITYPDLPVSAKRDEIAAAIAAHQVVVVAGETGSGKTTQLPKIALELGRGIRGTIGHTQPRRLAARTVAQRIADELHTELGDVVGYTVRFTDQVSDRTLVKLMTDGILLAEIQRDRRLRRYDTLILDEAHERSLNIDFLLGYLRQLLPTRPDLKVVVTSATIEPGRFAAHFAAPDGTPAPIVEVSGRTYPVELRYRPLEQPVARDDADDGGDADDLDGDAVRTETRDQTEAIVDAVHELEREAPGDVLVFLSGEREIRDTADALSDLRNTEVLPLYARLSTAEQHRVFEPHTGRRVVLSTNVAETSLTVPGIRYVVDPGTARISRYSRRTKVQRLPIEPISQASAAQRAGRCGRVADGIAIRLYSEADFDARPRYTDPEILRTNLASVILQMASLRLGDIEDFPFLDPPDRRSVRDGIALLQELGAFDGQGAITPLGRRLAQLPVDPRIGRMILAADEQGCVREVLVIAAALSIPDPRERPADREDAARQSHARFADEHSDFVGFLNLWTYLRAQRSERSGNQFRRMCRDEFLHYLRVREWQDLVGQLRSIARGLGIVETDQPAGPQQIHAALLAGLLSHVGLRDARTPREYLGARNSRFVLAPGSALTKRPPRWTVVAELVETSRLFGRIAASVDPEAVERVAGHLVQRSYSEPHWDAKRAAAMAYERVTLYGLPLVARRRVGYANVEPAEARELFLRHALVEGEWQTRHHFVRDNATLRAELEEVEERARRRDLLVDDEQLLAFFDARVPADIVSGRHFDAWWKKQRHTTPGLLTFTRDDLLRHDDAPAPGPDVWRAGDLELPVSYRFDPGADDDGITVHVPVDVLARLGGDAFAWQVPALREELVTELIRSLPKDLRRNFVPAPDTARAVLSDLASDPDQPLLAGVQRSLHRLRGVLVPLDAFDLDRIPSHLRVTFAVEGADGEVVARSKDLAGLQEQLAAPVRAAVASAVAGELERDGLTGWPADLDELPPVVERAAGDHVVRGHSALVDVGGTVAVRVFATAAEARAAMTGGVRRLLRLTVPSPVKSVERTIGTRARLVLGSNPDGSLAALLEDCADAAADSLVARLAPAGPPRTRAAFERLRTEVATRLPGETAAVLADVEQVLAAAHEVRLALPADPPRAQAEAIEDVREQFRRLLPAGFVTLAGRDHLRDLARYVTAVGRRLELLPRDVDTDRARMARVHAVRDAHDELVRALPSVRAGAEDVRDVARLIEEFRVSLWAQQLGTPRPVSEKRIYRAIDAIEP